MSDSAAHLFVLGIALLSFWIVAVLGPWITGLLGGLCILAAIALYTVDEESATSTDSEPPSRTNCPDCGARTPTGGSCEHCGAAL